MANILIVEDESVLRLTFAQFLEEDGHQVTTVENYAEAITHIEADPVEVVIADIVLGGKTGIELLRTIHDQGINASVIMITGEPNVETASEAVRLGAFDYLAKPVHGHNLKRVVRLALEQRKLARERDHYAARVDMYRRELEAIFHSVTEGIVTVDAELKVRQMNAAAAEMLGVDLDTERTLSAQELFPGDLERVVQAMRQTIANVAPVPEFGVEADLPRVGHKVFIASASPLTNTERIHTGAVLLLRDITRMSYLEKQLAQRHRYHKLIGKSAKMQEVFELIANVAETDATVLICGESGTGKELVAEAIHRSSRRAEKPFIKVNCAALPEDILESELFGHVKGAFTGAHKDRVGRFEAAHGGTILLDEIGDVSPRLQLRLLRVLQEREFERVGDTHPIHVDVRVIASTNQDLTVRIRNSEFREDLYYRLNVVRVDIPPLRQRMDDLPLLVEEFCKRFNADLNKDILGFSPEAMEILMRHQWPGNVRELENCIERAFIVCREPFVQPRHLPADIHDGSAAVPYQAGAPTAAAGDHLPERDRIQQVLEQTDWNVAKSARKLGMARNTLYQKMKAHQIQRPG